MAVVLDDFNRADSGDLGANWTQQQSSVGVVSNQATPIVNDVDNYAYWSANTFTDAHASSAVLTAFIARNIAGVTARASGTGSGTNAYVLYLSGSLSNSFLFKLVAGSYTLLQTFGVAFSAGDILTISVSGTNIICLRNGIQIGTTATDSDLSGGAPGIMGVYITPVAAGPALDDWVGDGAIIGNPWYYRAQQ